MALSLAARGPRVFVLCICSFLACQEHQLVLLTGRDSEEDSGAEPVDTGASEGGAPDAQSPPDAGVPSSSGAAGAAGAAGEGSDLSDSSLCTGDVCDEWGDQGDGTFKNPILWSDYANPDVLQSGDDFYMVSSTIHFMGLPILHSRDLVNWSFVGQINNRLDIDPRYDTPGHAYAHGFWGPSLREHDGLFWVYAATPEEGLFLTTAPSPEGPWEPFSLIVQAEHWQDVSPFWDDVPDAGGDGPNGRQAYLFRSQFAGGPVIVHRMSWDGRTILDEGTVVASASGLTGPKVMKKNGLYYIFASEGRISAGSEVVFRSSDIYGPYESRVVLEQGSTSTLGPHWGSFIDLPSSGQSWFLHSRSWEGWGRIVYLQPAGWADGWPFVGVDLNGNGVGEPVAQPMMPDVGQTYPTTLPANTDEFTTDELGPQWMWNHNPIDSWSLTERPGWLRLTAEQLAPDSGPDGERNPVMYEDDSILFAYGTLVQRTVGRTSFATTLLDVAGMVDGQRAGISLFGQDYAWIGVVQERGVRRIVANVAGEYTDGPELTLDRVYLRAHMSDTSSVWMAYSLYNEDFTTLGESLSVNRTWFQGIKYALFTYQFGESDVVGYADFDFLRMNHDGPSGM